MDKRKPIAIHITDSVDCSISNVYAPDTYTLLKIERSKKINANNMFSYQTATHKKDGISEEQINKVVSQWKKKNKENSSAGIFSNLSITVVGGTIAGILVIIISALYILPWLQSIQ